ncbi:hypothetical protein GN277_08760 [Lachnospiraceae bacterium WCA-9-b2]|uniref:Uncharacterized protein n=2 Tax=Sporofaciens musculi TaxID=2681861 RepID=A0A7X3MFV3_9FIRM|nr:hypothetical protein [Sporofaciens musculi]MXP75467.1 hypothetical protein [Sporofaciens musculi]
MPDRFRIHGDNIVECERIVNIILAETNPSRIEISLLSPSTIVYNLSFGYCGFEFWWQLELLPGFNKAGRKRWQRNIFNALKESGSFLDETPDAIVTCVDGDMETILYAIEFCSALQAGNQAWQRSGRAFSTGRTGCPYLYIVDFVKYELDPRTRERIALRFPNPAVPYSYINFSKESGNFVAQIYVRSEEFDKCEDCFLYNFDEKDFAEAELRAYIVKRMCGFDTSSEENSILQKNLNVVMFLANLSRPIASFTSSQWKRLYTYQQGIIQFSIENSDFNYHKIVTAKGHHGKSPEFLKLVDGCSVGLASKDLPFGIIPANKRDVFANGIQRIYPEYDSNIIRQIGDTNSDLILCIIKGFKPRGDDNRPDRGILPFVAMLSSTNMEVMTYIYGPVIANNLETLIKAPKRLAHSNGFWKSILALSNYIALDVPVLSGQNEDAQVLLNTSDLKKDYTAIATNNKGLTRNVFSSFPQEFHEDDVDTGIHFIFSHLLSSVCFEGMCNPPGGDWSGLSVLYKDYEVRWLSLPRVSKEINGKRPDHVLELFGVFDKPLLLSIESKEHSFDLEYHVGNGLINYITGLMNYIPNVERKVYPQVEWWHKTEKSVDIDDFEVISAAAYLRASAQPNHIVFQNSNCDMHFIMEPQQYGWKVEIVPNTSKSLKLKSFIKDKMFELKFCNIDIL